MSRVPQKGLAFAIADIERELRDVQRIAKAFVIPESQRVIDQCISDLKNIGTARGPQKWAIPRETPFKTSGSSEYDKLSRQPLFGHVSFVWEVYPSGKDIILCGNASMSLSLVDGGDSCVLRWNCDIGVHSSPGAHLHLQVQGPRAPPVPRFPTLVVTPADAICFLLGELFQERWPERLSKGGSSLSIFNNQKRRLCQLLQLHQSQINASNVPWLALKNWKPEQVVKL